MRQLEVGKPIDAGPMTRPSKIAESFQSGCSSLLGELGEFVSDYDVDMPLAVLYEWLPVVFGTRSNWVACLRRSQIAKPA
jgi:hypothetical protein